MNEQDTEYLITLQEAAKRLCISLRGIYRLIASDELPHPVKVGNASRLYASDIETYLSQLKETYR
ncbi:excisionase family DNA-binding protein [Kiritimatiellota bacterium B12222]|nr:excisionase family DNA-binding protein [Kiritimatiellota bacterium B12222]